MITDFRGKYTFLSNFFPSPFIYDGIEYPTNEHFFQAMKTEDSVQRRLISEARTPGLAKRMGRKAVLRPNWGEIKLDIMLYGLKKKFQDPALAAKLRTTHPKRLIEGNWWHDNYWGDCSCTKCKDIPGHNMLGVLLEIVRGGREVWCECENWARTNQLLITNHHRNCKKYDPEKEAYEIIEALLDGIQGWADD